MLKIADMNEVYADRAKPGGWNGQCISFGLMTLKNQVFLVVFAEL